MNALVAALLLVPTLALAQIQGRASVIDGDTLEVQGQRVRLAYVDAPESSQTCGDPSGRQYRCGQAAAMALADFIGPVAVRCTVTGRDRYGRYLGECFKGDHSLNAWLVRNGHAVAYRRYGGQRFVPDEVAARREGRGVWQGAFVEPEEFRRLSRRG